MRRLLAVLLAVGLAAIPSWVAAQTINPIATGRTGMVACAAPPPCARGGAEPAASGLGGGGFILIRLANGQIGFIDYREMAPKAAKPTMYLGPDGKVIPSSTTVGHLAVGVPGALAGLGRAP